MKEAAKKPAGFRTYMLVCMGKVKGLTTAAGLWAADCIGLAIGIGFYEGAILSTIMIFVAMVSLHKLDDRIVGSSKLITHMINAVDGVIYAEEI